MMMVPEFNTLDDFDDYIHGHKSFIENEKEDLECVLGHLMNLLISVAICALCVIFSEAHTTSIERLFISIIATGISFVILTEDRY